MPRLAASSRTASARCPVPCRRFAARRSARRVAETGTSALPAPRATVFGPVRSRDPATGAERLDGAMSGPRCFRPAATGAGGRSRTGARCGGAARDASRLGSTARKWLTKVNKSPRRVAPHRGMGHSGVTGLGSAPPGSASSPPIGAEFRRQDATSQRRPAVLRSAPPASASDPSAAPAKRLPLDPPDGPAHDHAQSGQDHHTGVPTGSRRARRAGRSRARWTTIEGRSSAPCG